MTQPAPRDKPEAGPAGPSPLGGPKIDWRQVLAEHERWLRTVIYSRLGEPQAVEEVLQEVSLAAVRQKAPILDPQKVSA
jgi:DNA-directed RNA polymerase specialized sigma24 family protein